MNKNQIIKVVLPLAAIVVIMESLVLINGINQKNQLKNGQPENVKTGSLQGGPTNNEVKKDAKLDVVISSTLKEVKKGELFPVKVNIAPKEDVALDAVNLYVTFDAKNLDISSLAFNPKLPKPTFQKVSTTKEVVVVNFLITESKGFKLAKGESFEVMSFDAKANKEGSYKFEISTGNETKESVTMFVANATSEVMPFSSNSLNVKVLR